MRNATSGAGGVFRRAVGLAGVALAFFLMTASFLASGCTDSSVGLNFSQAPVLPDPVGFAGMGAGTVGDSLVAVGGANFPARKPWEGGVKVFNRSVYAFENGAWRIAGELPGVVAYPAYAGTKDGLIVAGGTDDRDNFRSVFRVSVKGGEVAQEKLPDLPAPVAFAACAVWRGMLVVIGGTDSPSATVAQNTVYALDPANVANGWTRLPALPGRGRMLSVAGTHDGKLYVFGGCALSPDAAGKPVRTYLREALVLDEARGAWIPVRELPEPLVASAGPAPSAGDVLLLLGGDTGFFYNNGKSPAEHPGQPKTVYAYRPGDDMYAVAGELPVGVVTAPAVEFQGKVWLVSGETGPGRRTNTVTVIGRR